MVAATELKKNGLEVTFNAITSLLSVIKI